MVSKKGKFTTMFDEDEVKDLIDLHSYWKGFATGAVSVAALFVALMAWASYLVN